MESYILHNLNKESFGAFGDIIEYNFDQVTGRDFQVVAKTESTGWCIGILELRRDVAPYMERHLHSKETHEPLRGTTILIVALPEYPEDFKVFLLDKPVCLNKGVWHQVMAISEKATIKVVENLEVPPNESETRELRNGVKLSIGM